jgi:hypothetical protein
MMSKDKDSGMNPEDFLLHSKEISDATIPKKHCAVTRDILLYLNELSVDIGYNQNLADWLFDDSNDIQIDRKFPVFLRLVVPHHYIAGEPTDTHYRTVWEFVFTDDFENSHTGMIDIPAEAYHLLPEVPEVVQVDNDTYELWSKLDTETITSDFIDEVESLLREETEKEEE